MIQQIEEDDFFKYFLKSGCNSVLNYSMTLTEQVKRLVEGVELLNEELQKQILNKHDDLLQQAEHATKLETVLNIINTHVQNLFANAERLKAEITLPYNELEKHTKVLDRLQLASHILRQVNRLQQLSKRLNNTSDPVQKATVLQELEQLASDPELINVEAVTTELRNIRSHQQKLIKLATGSLNQGLLNENVTQTTTALQIFHNLGTIKTTTDNLIQENLDECQKCLKTAFSSNISGSITKSKGGPGRLLPVSSSQVQNKIQNEIEKLFSEDIYQICKQVKFLQVTLNGLNTNNMELNIANVFWVNFGIMLEKEVQNAIPAVQQTMEEHYPKLLKNYYEMIKKLKFDEFFFDKNVFCKPENSYLSTSLTRMLDSAQLVFNIESMVPSHDQIDSLVRVITSELSVALIEENLSEQVSKNVAKCINTFIVKTQHQLEMGPETAQVIAGSPNSGQQKNINLANALYYLQTQCQRILFNMKESLPKSCVNIITESLQSADTLTAAILQPLVGSIISVTETIIVTLHLETDWPRLPVPTNKNYQSCSPYMKELSQFITRAYQTYLASFENKDVLSTGCSDIAMRCIDLFVRHTALLRPISFGGRLRLQADYVYLENTLKIICPLLSDLGRSYRLLKSMASLIVLAPSDIVCGQIFGSSVPHSTILFMLFGFAGAELTSPHQVTGWSLPKLSAWLDEHSGEEDRLDLIAGTLQRYEQFVRQKNSVNYDPVYPIMSQFLESAVKQYK